MSPQILVVLETIDDKMINLKLTNKNIILVSYLKFVEIENCWAQPNSYRFLRPVSLTSILRKNPTTK